MRRMGNDVLDTRMTDWAAATANVVAIELTRAICVVIGQREPKVLKNVVIDTSKNRSRIEK